MGVEDGSGGDGVRPLRMYSPDEKTEIRQKHLQTIIGHIRNEAVGFTERFKSQVEGRASSMGRDYSIEQLEDILLNRVPKSLPDTLNTGMWIYLIGTVEALSAKYEERERQQSGRE